MSQHNVDVQRIQLWLWECVKAGWRPGVSGAGKQEHWSHDDNMAAQPLGWMIIRPPNSKLLALMSLRPGVDSSKLYRQIADMAPIDPICAKAFAVLTAQQLQHPTLTFEYRKEL